MTRHRAERLWTEIALLAIVLCWAANYSVLQVILENIPVRALVALRFGIITVAGWIVLAAVRAPAAIRRADWPRLLLIGVIGGGVYQYVFVLGLAETTSFSSALLNTTAPLLSLMLLAALRIERIAPLQWIGNIVAFLGVGVFLLESARAGGTTLAGDLISLGAAFCWAIYGILSKRLSHEYPAVTVCAWTYTVCFLSIATYGAAPALRLPYARIPAVTWGLLLASGVISVTLGWIVWIRGIRVLGVSGTVKFSFLVPISAGIIARVFQGERFTAAKILGALAVLVGIFVARVPGWRTPPIEPERGEPERQTLR